MPRGCMHLRPTQYTGGTTPQASIVCALGISRCLGRYRLGGHHLSGRLHGYGQECGRTCPLCSGRGLRAEWIGTPVARCGGDKPEDLLHFVLECPAYDYIRGNYASVFAFDGRDSAQPCMQCLFSITHTRPSCLIALQPWMCLATLAREGQPVGLRPIPQPDGYVAVMPYPACLHHATSFSLHTRSLRLGALHCDTLAVAAGALIAAVLWVLLCVLARQVISLMFWLLHVSRLDCKT
jgi:hypothetical protein